MALQHRLSPAMGCAMGAFHAQPALKVSNCRYQPQCSDASGAPCACKASKPQQGKARAGKLAPFWLGRDVM